MATPRCPAETIIPMFTGYVITPIPLILLFTFASRFFIEGLTSGAFKVCAHCYKPVTTPAANPA